MLKPTDMIKKSRYTLLKLLTLILFTAVTFMQLSVYAEIYVDSLKGENLNTSSGQLKPQESKIKVVIFLSARCPCSNSHREELNNLVESYPQFEFIGVHSNMNEPLDEAKNYFSKNQFKFAVIQDQKTHIADLFKAFKTPHAFVVNEKNEIVYKGGVSSSNTFKKESVTPYLREVLQDLSQNKPPRYTEKRSLGCVILRENEGT